MKLPPLPRALRAHAAAAGRGRPRTAAQRPERRAPAKAKPTAKDHAVEGVAGVVGWLDERTGASPFLRGFLYRKVPKGTNWYYTLGSATMFAFLSQAVTGVFLAMYYEPDSTRAYESASRITNEVFLGEFVRGMHKWGSTRDDHPDLPPHGQDVLLRRVQVPARAELGHRRGAARAHADDGPHRLPAAVRPALLLGHGRGRQHQRVRADRRALPGRLPARGLGVRADDDLALLRAPHARRARPDRGADRRAPLPRGQARHHRAAVAAGPRRRTS